MFLASVYAGAFLMDGLPAIHLCLLLKVINRSQRLSLRLRVAEDGESLGMNLMCSPMKKRPVPNKWVLLCSNQIGMTAVFVYVE